MTVADRRAFLGVAAAAVAGVAAVGAVDLFSGHAAAARDLGGIDEPQFAELTPFKDALRIPPTLRPKGTGVTEIDMVEARIRLHSQLPPTRLWTYRGHFPGPTIDVRQGQLVRIAWTNKLTGTTPVKAVWVRGEGPGPGKLPYNTPGAPGGFARPEIDALTAWTTVHVHGGHQHAASDGATEYGITPGNAQLGEYANDQAATHLFYHDHAMSVTALNVLAGLFGHYLIRDDEEDRLDLPRGRYEIPLAIGDVNFDTDPRGRLTGQLLGKRVIAGHRGAPPPGTIPASVPFFGPFTMANGVVWPYLSVEARSYRFRVVNVSLARAYRLAVIDEQTGQTVAGAMTLIGTDLGLLDKPLVIDETLSLSCAERADVVIDFAAHPGKRLKLVNTDVSRPAGAAAPAANIPYPDVMEFRVGPADRPARPLPAALSGNFRRLSAADVPAHAVERFVLTSYDKSGVMPQLWEMQEVDPATPAGDGIVQVALPSGVKTLRRVGVMFEDTTTFFASSETWEKWHFINVVSPPAPPINHPMHIHLMNFQVIQRASIEPGGMDFAAGGTRRPITLGAPLAILPEESGWKDTVTVASNTLVTVAGQLARQTGKVMYHCHFLDHEDEGMMRPFVIMPAPVNRIHDMLMAMASRPMAR
ncbi:multicopper oxidase family protein [Mycobacterium sp. URHB0021]